MDSWGRQFLVQYMSQNTLLNMERPIMDFTTPMIMISDFGQVLTYNEVAF